MAFGRVWKYENITEMVNVQRAASYGCTREVAKHERSVTELHSCSVYHLFYNITLQTVLILHEFVANYNQDLHARTLIIGCTSNQVTT